ncbi:MAG TPA: hypothetical protein VF666_02735 [Pyrinomonadaceae bacterium]
MKRQHFASLFAVLLLAFCSNVGLAANDAEEDTDTRMIAARVVEVTDARISVIARSGVEHVIAIDNADTKVKIDGKLVSLKDVREGDIVTVELDEKNPLKFARNIEVEAQANNQQVARGERARRH